MKTPANWPLLLVPPLLCAALVACGGGSTAPITSPDPAAPVPSPIPGPAPAPLGGPPAGAYSCLLLTLTYLPPDFYPSPTYVPSILGTLTIGPGNAYSALSSSGTFTFDPVKSWVTFRGGPFDRVNASFERLKRDGTPTLHFEEKLGDPAPDVRIGDSVCYG